MGYVQYTVPGCSCRIYFRCFPLALADICPWPLLPFFQISLKNSELKTTHNTFLGVYRRETLSFGPTETFPLP